MGIAYYNECDPKAAAWLRELIKDGLIASGDVDERSILDIRPHELTRYTQQHFFAGIGGWSYALRLAGWPDNEPVRTGSCPCQPFSQAGKGLAEKDERHLWPAFRDLITFGDPTITFGEQVASPLGREWLAGVRADLEALGYHFGAADLCAAGVGAPHPRQRLYWMGYPNRARSQQRRQAAATDRYRNSALANGCSRGMANATDDRRAQHDRESRPWKLRADDTAERCGDNGRRPDRMADSGHQPEGRRSGCGEEESRRTLGDTPGCSPWSDFDLLPFRDGKLRRVESGSFPLAHGIPGRVGLLRGYGNAIVPQVASEFIQACIESIT